MNYRKKIERLRDELGPDYPEAHVMLIDALRAYIRCNEQIRDDIQREGSLTPERAKAGAEHVARFQALLDEIEEHSFNSSLYGLIKPRAQP